MKKLGRPVTGKAMVMIGIRVPTELWQALEIEASKQGYNSAGELAREILIAYMKGKR